ncbi:MAG TPA: tetratricopeptide repeat protein [Pyrinomonadaceae bacterium]|nr:tetratricopeptide repeat protein [Pyrinomonadaceae bacterium]
MKYLLPIVLLFAGIPICAQTDDEVYFRRRLEEARHGDAGAQDDVGTLYAEARGVKRDYRKAVFWLKKSAAQGNVSGACNLAIEITRGHDVRRNPALALKWVLISHSLDHLKCFPDDFVDALKPSKSQIRQARNSALAWLRAHSDLKDEFGDRPWLDHR